MVVTGSINARGRLASLLFFSNPTVHGSVRQLPRKKEGNYIPLATFIISVQLMHVITLEQPGTPYKDFRFALKNS